MDEQRLDTPKVSFGTAGLLLGAAAATSATVAVANPKDWADIAERVGIPTMILLLVVMVVGYFIRLIGAPLVRTHIDFVGGLRDTAKANAEAAKINAEAILQLKNLAERGMDLVRELHAASQKNQLEIMGALRAKSEEKSTNGEAK